MHLHIQHIINNYSNVIKLVDIIVTKYSIYAYTTYFFWVDFLEIFADHHDASFHIFRLQLGFVMDGIISCKNDKWRTLHTQTNTTLHIRAMVSLHNNARYMAQ